MTKLVIELQSRPRACQPYRERKRIFLSSSAMRGTDPAQSMPHTDPARWVRSERASAELGGDGWPTAGRSWPPRSRTSPCSRTAPPARRFDVCCGRRRRAVLRDHQGGERGVSGLFKAAIDVPLVSKSAQGDGSGEAANEGDTREEAPIDQFRLCLSRRTRRARRDRSGRSRGQGRQPIRHQVDPQQLDRQERQRPAHQGGDEHDDELAALPASRYARVFAMLS